MPDFRSVCVDENGVYGDSSTMEGYTLTVGEHIVCATSNLTCLTKYTRSVVLNNTEGW